MFCNFLAKFRHRLENWKSTASPTSLHFWLISVKLSWAFKVQQLSLELQYNYIVIMVTLINIILRIACPTLKQRFAQQKTKPWKILIISCAPFTDIWLYKVYTGPAILPLKSIRKSPHLLKPVFLCTWNIKPTLVYLVCQSQTHTLHCDLCKCHNHFLWQFAFSKLSVSVLRCLYQLWVLILWQIFFFLHLCGKDTEWHWELVSIHHIKTCSSCRLKLQVHLTRI